MAILKILALDSNNNYIELDDITIDDVNNKVSVYNLVFESLSGINVYDYEATSTSGTSVTRMRSSVRNGAGGGAIDATWEVSAKVGADGYGMQVRNGWIYAVRWVAGVPTYYDLWHAGNDGAGSGLDADLLDGVNGAAYLARANHTGTQTLATISDAGTMAAQNANAVAITGGTATTSSSSAGAVVVPTRVVNPNNTTGTGAGVEFALRAQEDYKWRAAAIATAGSPSSLAPKFVLALDNAAGSYTDIATFTGAGLSVTGAVSATTTLKPGSYTVATVPAATAGGLIYVTNEVGGAVPAFADGTNWRRVTDRAIVS